MSTLPRTSGCCDGHFSQFSDVLWPRRLIVKINRQIIIIIVSYSPINKCMMCALLHLLPQPTVMSWCIEWHVLYITATRWVKPLKVSKNNKNLLLLSYSLNCLLYSNLKSEHCSEVLLMYGWGCLSSAGLGIVKFQLNACGCFSWEKTAALQIILQYNKKHLQGNYKWKRTILAKLREAFAIQRTVW